MIKDSGDRTEFETGAKRDMHAGKGRMDLLPWYGIMEVSKHCEEGALNQRETHPELDDRFSVKQEKTQKKRPWISVECTNCNKRHPVAPEVWLYDMDEVPASSRILKCPFCNEHWIHKYIGNLDEYANPDEKLVAVKCGDCNAHFGIPTSNWNSMKECTIHNGEVLARCPRCGKDTFISEVSADE